MNLVCEYLLKITKKHDSKKKIICPLELFSSKVWLVASFLSSLKKLFTKLQKFLNISFFSGRNLHLKEELCQFSIYLHFKTSNDNFSDQYRDILSLLSVLKSAFKELSEIVQHAILWKKKKIRPHKGANKTFICIASRPQ